MLSGFSWRIFSKYGRDQSCCWGSLVCCRACDIEWCVGDINREMDSIHNSAVFLEAKESIYLSNMFRPKLGRLQAPNQL